MDGSRGSRSEKEPAKHSFKSESLSLEGKSSVNLCFGFPKTKISCTSWCVTTWRQSCPIWLNESPKICTWTFVDMSSCQCLFLLLYCIFTFLKAVRWNSLWSLVNSLAETCPFSYVTMYYCYINFHARYDWADCWDFTELMEQAVKIRLLLLLIALCLLLYSC